MQKSYSVNKSIFLGKRYVYNGADVRNIINHIHKAQGQGCQDSGLVVRSSPFNYAVLPLFATLLLLAFKGVGGWWECRP